MEILLRQSHGSKITGFRIYNTVQASTAIVVTEHFVLLKTKCGSEVAAVNVIGSEGVKHHTAVINDKISVLLNAQHIIHAKHYSMTTSQHAN